MKHRAARKRLTTSAQDWLKQAEASVRVIERLKETSSIHGLSWTQKMVAHYTLKYQEFRMYTPGPCKNRARLLDERVNFVMVWAKNLI